MAGGLAGLFEQLIGLGWSALRNRQTHQEPPVENHSVFVVGEQLESSHLPSSERTVSLTTSDRARHLYLLGASGAGKTNLLMRLVEADIQAKRNLVLFDLRCDFLDRFVLRTASVTDADQLADRLCLLDLRENNYIVGLNPLQARGEPSSRALHVLNVVRGQAESWGVQLDESLRNGFTALAESGWSLLELEPLFGNSGFRREVLRHVHDDAVQNFFGNYDRLTAEKQLSWSLAALNKVSPILSSPHLRRIFGQRRGLNWEDLLNTPGQLVGIGLAVDRFYRAAHLVGGLLVSSIEAAVLGRVDQAEAERVPVTLALDEFEAIATDSFEALIAECRRFGMSLVLSHQDLMQLPLKLRKTIRTNIATQLYFQTSADDAGELAREILTEDSQSEIREQLMRQDIGGAFLVRHGQPSVRVRTPYSPDPEVIEERIATVREQALKRCGRPKAEVDAELAERRHWLQAEFKPTIRECRRPAYKGNER